MFHKAKYSKKPEKKAGNPFVFLIPVTIVLILAVVLVLIFGDWVAPADKPQDTSSVTQPTVSSMAATDPTQDTEPTTATTENTEPVQQIIIDTAVCPLVFPGEFSDYMSHAEVVDDGAVVEFFYMVKDEIRLELFQIIFSAKPSDNDIGLIKEETGNLYISVSASNLDDQMFDDEQSRDLYHNLMACVDVVLDSIRADARFSKKSEVDINIVDTKLDYWDVALPEHMSWEETHEGGSYLVTFYGEVNGQKYKLYSAAIGDNRLTSVLGSYIISSQIKPVSVESYDLPDTDGWDEAAVTELYTMMSTINDLIQAIMSDEAFSAEIDEG